MSNRFLSCLAAVGVILTAWTVWWVNDWRTLRPTPASGGMWCPGRVAIEVPHFSQGDPRWGKDNLGRTTDTLSAQGCAVTCAAMVLASRGLKVDPGTLNSFLTLREGGYTEQGWIFWERAVEFPPNLSSQLLPHYEHLPSHYLIDKNLLCGNPVIARIAGTHTPNHFVVIAGKKGYDYLILDPSAPPGSGLTPLKDSGGPINAIRYYKVP